MIHPRPRLARAAAAALLSLFATAAHAATYSITEIGPLPSVTTGSFAYGLNNAGQVAGYSAHPFRWSAGTSTDLRSSLPTSILAPSPARAINDDGAVVGSFATASTIHAFLWKDGVWTDLTPTQTTGHHAVSMNAAGDVAIVGSAGLLRRSNGTTTTLPGFGGASVFQPADVNDALQVVGFATTATGALHAALWENSVSRDLGTLDGDVNSAAHALNAYGHVVGASYAAVASAAATRAFVWRNDLMLALPSRQAGEGAVALDINALGYAVGYAGADRALHHSPRPTASTAALLWEYGEAVDLQTRIPGASGWTLLSAEAINEAGQIAGYGFRNNSVRAFLLTPATPLPTPGDADGNGGLTPNDAAAILDMAVGLTAAGDTRVLDVAPQSAPTLRGYGDGVLDATDALRVLGKAAGLSPRWPF